MAKYKTGKEIKVTDIVSFISGGPLITVTFIPKPINESRGCQKDMSEYVQCSWFDKKHKFHSGIWVRIDCLVFVREA